MSEYSEAMVSDVANYYYDQLLEKLIYKLKRSKDLRLMPDCSLNNLWEEICVQKQMDHWYGWHLVEEYIESLCLNLIENLPWPIQQCLLYDGDEDTCMPARGVEVLSAKLYDVAREYSNKRIHYYVYFT